ncbi:SDR family NAD(P)-dependent oxidoreductase [Tropicibacter naphthalenivorans]|uniref:Gluconate 5-dehydrogenase n=1 Tax=Tropicibacter naphthalenivorans TaxID=441103 RepID=A0A0P1GJF6_9RHOB|nr:SDR family oxidoreductase [Tropicibacter naphthalenivorans]CUH81971.1 Gluconate 5-dehydrogenase [Tropicibacter naphthalenivorans]SMD07848.1 2-deoxy-D-gluconate 3-dehydrogenase [Tropicibacter naphthalenivorans]
MPPLPTTPSFDLTGRRVLVTGASSGIGLGCAVAMAEAGAEVTCVARRPDPLRAAVDQITALGGTARAVPCDIADLTQLAALFDGPDAFDVVINAAGLARHTKATDTTVQDFDDVMAVNLRAAYFLSQNAAKALQAKGRGGAIIHVSSQMGHVGGPERAVYCASKHALEGMVKAMALEWGADGIRINTLCPTFVKTPLTEPTFADPEKRAWINAKIALGHPAEVQDLMGAALFLASDAARMVTGTALMVDGGWTAA